MIYSITILWMYLPSSLFRHTGSWSLMTSQEWKSHKFKPWKKTDHIFSHLTHYFLFLKCLADLLRNRSKRLFQVIRTDYSQEQSDDGDTPCQNVCRHLDMKSSGELYFPGKSPGRHLIRAVGQKAIKISMGLCNVFIILREGYIDNTTHISPKLTE